MYKIEIHISKLNTPTKTKDTKALPFHTIK